MKKVYLSVIGFAFICRLTSHAQTTQDTTRKPVFSLYTPVEQSPGSDYKSRALHIDEINLVSSYYLQNGNHSPVTGGLGTEHVTDLSSGLDLKLAWQADELHKNSLTFGMGYDHHTSASASYVALLGGSNTGGHRLYPSMDWTRENTKTGETFGIGAYYSGEYNYKSKGLDVHWSIKTPDKNGEFSVKLQAYLDQVTLIYPSDVHVLPTPTVVSTGPTYITTASGNVVLSNGGSVSKPSLPTSPRNTYTASFGYSQILSSRLQVMFLADLVTQSGYLGLPFHRVYFNTGKDTVEKVPSSRFKIPVGFRANYFLGDNIILRSYYRYYWDNWGTNANTASLEIAYKINPFFSISPYYRYYSQSAAKYFAPYGVHTPDEEYYTSNYEYAQFQSGFYGVGFRFAPPKGVFGWQNLHELEIRYGHYTQTTGLASDVLSLSLGFK